MLRGGCLCGGVRYEIQGELGSLSHCHCSMCRKAHGAAFGTYGRVQRAEFRLLAGEDLIARYRSSPGIDRTFCSRCGSTLQFAPEDRPESFGLAVGTLDDDPGHRPILHTWVGSKAPWLEITDELPQHETEP